MLPPLLPFHNQGPPCMCGRFTLRTPLGALTRKFLFSFDDEVRPRYNVAPMQLSLVLRDDLQGQRTGAMLRWGLLPGWAKDPKIASSMINARSETLAEKPAFRTAFKRKRCLVIIDGYYEWRTEGKQKLPLLYEMADGQPFALAGLWESWRGGPSTPENADESKIVETFSIITVPANRLASAVHDRMPAILGADDWSPWLDSKTQDGAQVAHLLASWPDDDSLRVRPANPRVNKVQNDDPECLQP
jgi:putative SOS response-associated peptidase YedK